MTSLPNPFSRQSLMLSLIVIGGLIVRIALAPYGSFEYDAAVMRNWAHILTTAPLGFYYDQAFTPDHLPGDLWILWYVANAFRAVGDGDIDGLEFLLALKLVPAIADGAIGILLYAIARSIRDARAGLAAAAMFMFNPASIFLTSTWGQWDSVSMALALLAIVFFLQHRYVLAGPVLTYAILIKPQFGILLVLLVAAYVLYELTARPRPSLWRTVQTIGLTLLASAVLALAALLPFGIGVPPLTTQWSLVERLEYSLDLWTGTTLRAFNAWILPIGVESAPPDSVVWGALTYQEWGVAGFATCLLLAGFGFWLATRASFATALMTLCLAAMLGSFLFTTRVHERYLFPALVLAILLGAISRPMLVAPFILTGTFLVNLVWVYDLEEPDWNVLVLTSDTIRIVTALNLMVLAWTLVPRPWQVMLWARLRDRLSGQTKKRASRSRQRPAPGETGSVQGNRSNRG